MAVLSRIYRCESRNLACCSFVRSQDLLYSGDVVICNLRYEHFVPGRLRLAIATQDMHVLIQVRKAAACERWKRFQISSNAVLYAFLNSFSTILKVTWFRLPCALAIVSTCTLCYFAGAAQDHTYKQGSTAWWYQSCSAAWREMLPLDFNGSWPALLPSRVYSWCVSLLQVVSVYLIDFSMRARSWQKPPLRFLYDI